MSEIYVLDATVFINSWTKHYPHNVFPCVWECLEQLMYEDRVIIPQVIYEEVKRGGDDLLQWMNWYKLNCVKRPDERSVLGMKKVVQTYPKLLQVRKNSSGSGGDPWVIALAQIAGAVVVTDEFPTGNIESPKIPDVCIALNIKYIRTVELLRRCGLRAIRDGSPGDDIGSVA